MESEEYIEWRNQHELQEFPFIGSSGYLPDDLFVDLSIACYGATSLWLSSLSVQGNLLKGLIKSSRGDSFYFSQTTFNASNSTATITSDSGRIVGSVVFGPSATDAVAFVNNRSNSITSGVVKIDPSCAFILNVNQVSSITIGRTPYSGVVKLVEGEGVEITGTGSNIVVNATGYNTIADCCVVDYTPLKSINGVAPVSGRLNIKARDIGQPLSTSDIQQLIRVRPISNGIEISLAN